jgi:integrase
MPGWSVTNSNGKIRLQLRRSGEKAQGVTLPLDWEKSAVAKATQLIARIYKSVEGQQQTLRGALEGIVAGSDTMRTGTNWSAVEEGLKCALMDGRNEIKASTWRDNYQPYIQEALRLLAERNPPNDGHELLRRTLEKWQGKAASRAACCIAVRNLTDHAIARHRAPACWRIDIASIKELRGKAPKKRVKAALEDSEIIYLIDGIQGRNPRWANVLRILALYGLRPIELQHIQAKHREDGTLALWCAYQKNCGGQLTDPRWIEPCPVKDGTGNPQHWNLAGAMAAGLLELPLGSDGRPRELNGHYVEQFLRRQPEWRELLSRCEARGEWLRGYTFRDSYSLRCHRYGIEVGAVASSMGHSVAVHSGSYRWASEATTAAAFQKALA